MRALDQVDVSSSSLARTALTTAAVLAVLGSAVGIVAMLHGPMLPAERVLVCGGGLFGTVMLIALTSFRRVSTQAIALVSTTFYGLYLSAGLLMALLSPGHHENALIYLQWFFPLLLLNRMVNSPGVSRLASPILIAAPLLIIGVLCRRLVEMGSPTLVYLTIVDCLSYILFALMLKAVARYREACIVESEREESLRMQAQVLESISECFISMDPDFTLTYANDAACSELRMNRGDLLKRPISTINHGFFPQSMLMELAGTAKRHDCSVHEVRNDEGQWYEMRCFTHPDRISISFRNVTDVILSRQELEAAYDRLRQQSELLDKAHDAIYVHDMERRIQYWNKGAEHLFGLRSEDVLGRKTDEIYEVDMERIRIASDAMRREGDWSGELKKTKRDGTQIIVDSKVKLLRDEQGNPQSVLIINTDITARKTAESRIQKLAFYDHLTGLPNRVLLIDQLERMLLQQRQANKHCALLIIDLDDFKTLNDTAGHDAGDGLLQQVARSIQASIRKMDSLARFGGDEFVVILEGLSEDKDAAAAETRTVSEKVLNACRQPYVTPQCVFESTASIGVALFVPRHATVEDLLKRADLAMYQAKAQGRNAICFFDAAMETSASARAVLLADMRRAIQNQEFELHYQPQNP
jgi:diguanylate cyclase (GGDEF)-like protein/PAS domain S-box-containing protein